MSYRNLNQDEIYALEKQNCSAIDGWDKVKITHNFTTAHVKNTTFSGINYLGNFAEKISLPSGAIDFEGIYNAHLHNCNIQDGCYIKNIGGSISNYHIESNVIIQNIGTLMVNGESCFGNGVEISPINEAGGREIIIYNDLSVHTAYLMAFYQHRPKLIKSMKKNVLNWTESIKSSQGRIGEGTVISNCKQLNNIAIGEYAVINGVEHLNNGTINSSKESSTFIGTGVNASNFIVCSGSTVTDGAMLKHCFVGQGCEISSSYTAENSVFFANSQCLQGEACSIFAGPYTVTHHKSTLLIAGYYSFFNAGSGTNQSNHMYKLGPVHQGIVERGGKTGSDSYILWPAQIGAFTMVLGRHYGNPDISNLPFSYLIEDSGKSILMPAQNLFNVGITRDVQKWPKRDKRKGTNHLDFIICDALNPYTVDKIINAIGILRQLQEKASPQGKNLMYKNVQLSLTSINRGIKLYEQALVKYVGDELVNAINQANFDKVRKSYNSNNKKRWIDLGGLICKTDSVMEFMTYIELDNIAISNWNTFYKKQFEEYKISKALHAFEVLHTYFNINASNCSNNEISSFIENWREENIKMKNSIIMDAKKEFNDKSKISFGIDGDMECRVEDFEMVRGSIENNSFAIELEKEYMFKNKEAQSAIEHLSK